MMETGEERGALKGILCGGDAPHVRGDGGERLMAREPIWKGYLLHWEGERVRCRFLPQRDYISGRPIVLVWPDDSDDRSSRVDLYCNERLVKYPASRFGHVAVNAGGRVFNFSHLMNENEELSEEEYLYRPALGEFAPHPVTGGFRVTEGEPPYYDKFGRRFMRRIHLLRITGIDAGRLRDCFRHELGVIRATPADPLRPQKYAGFSFFTRSCSTIIRDGFRKSGYPAIGGVAPADFFISAVRTFLAGGERWGLSVSVLVLDQLHVPEAPPSRPAPALNPVNRLRVWKMRGKGIPLFREDR